MKKNIICGITSLALATIPVINTFATGTGTQNHDVTIGEVDETIYSVDITWDDMVFDWKYEQDINKYNFEPSRKCESDTYINSSISPFLKRLFDRGALYQDSTCSTAYGLEPTEGATVYTKTKVENRLTVSDSSTNGKVKAYASFVPSEDYTWVIGEFTNGGGYYDYEEISAMNISREEYLPVGINNLYYYYGERYNDGQALRNHVSPSSRNYNAELVLKTDPEVNSSNVVVNSNDTIGTVVITIEPDLN